jgi:DNA-binding transcriptional MerR regulator
MAENDKLTAKPIGSTIETLTKELKGLQEMYDTDTVQYNTDIRNLKDKIIKLGLDLKDIKELYSNEVKQNKSLTIKNNDLEADLIIKQEIIKGNIEETKKAIKELKNITSKLITEKQILETKLDNKIDFNIELRNIIYKLIGK